MKALEVVIQTIIVCTAMVSAGLVTRWWYFGASYPADFIICYNAALGNFDPLQTGNMWLWKPWVAVIFKPFLWTDLFRAAMIFAGIQTICFMLLAHKMMEVRFGWILVLVAIPSFESLLKVGNIQISLCLAAIYPVPALLAILVKPHHAFFALCLAIAERHRLRTEQGKCTRKK